MFNYILIPFFFTLININSSSTSNITDIKVTKDSVIISGYFSDNITIFKEIKLKSEGKNDAFIVKYSKKDMKPIWYKKFGGKGDDRITSITLDKDENLYITGFFEDTIKFYNKNFISNGTRDIFISKLDKNGNYKWSDNFGSPFWDMGLDIKIDNKNIILTSFGSAQDKKLLTTGYQVATLSYWDKDSGDLIWKKNLSTDSAVRIDDLTFSKDKIFILIKTQNSIKIDDKIIFKKGEKDKVIIFSKNGNYLGSIPISQSHKRDLKSILYYKDSLYIGGRFINTISVQNNNIKSNGSYDIFLIKFTDNKFQWIFSAGTEREDSLTDLAIYKENICYTGYNYGLGYNIDTFSNNNYITDIAKEVVAVCLSTKDKKLKFAKALIGTGPDMGLKLDSIGENLYIAGKFTQSLNILSKAPIYSISGNNLFIWILNHSN